MSASEQANSGGQPTGVLGFAMAAACFTSLSAFLSLFLVSAPRPAGIALANGAMVGLAIFLPYGWLYSHGTRKAIENLDDLFSRMRSGDEQAAQKFALLTFRMKDVWPESRNALVRRTLNDRARISLAVTLLLIVVIGIWVGQETVRQEARLVWDWRSIVWQWP